MRTRLRRPQTAPPRPLHATATRGRMGVSPIPLTSHGFPRRSMEPPSPDPRSAYSEMLRRTANLRSRNHQTTHDQDGGSMVEDEQVPPAGARKRCDSAQRDSASGWRPRRSRDPGQGHRRSTAARSGHPREASGIEGLWVIQPSSVIEVTITRGERVFLATTPARPL